MKPTDTPRTDEALWRFNESKGDVVSADFARELERELADLIKGRRVILPKTKEHAEAMSLAASHFLNPAGRCPAEGKT